jgi:tellurite resistance protein
MKEKESENILEKAVKAINDQQVPPAPPRELANSTIAKLTEISGQTNTYSDGRRIRLIERIKVPNSFSKVAAAAILLIMAGYATGRLLSPKPPDIEQLQASLEPAIRQNILDEMKQYWQLGLTASYAQLKDDLSQQYRRDLTQFATYTLAASGAATNQLLEELIESINTAQIQDRQWVAAAIGEIELNRLKDNAQLSNAFATFAVQTEDELLRNKQKVEQILYYTQPDSLVPNRFTDPNNLN